MSDIKETKELVQFLTILANSTDLALADGKFNFLDFGLFFQLIPQLSPALNGLKNVPEEILDVDAAERAELVQLIEQTLQLRAPNTEVLVEKGADLALHFAEYVREIRIARATGERLVA
jgi:hypothetical protein